LVLRKTIIKYVTIPYPELNFVVSGNAQKLTININMSFSLQLMTGVTFYCQILYEQSDIKNRMWALICFVVFVAPVSLIKLKRQTTEWNSDAEDDYVT